ncbi:MULTISPECIES: hypothetical protein [unclassified Nostoc]|nr:MULTISPECIES: hypothetical protein [unclassified Nostoc]
MVFYIHFCCKKVGNILLSVICDRLRQMQSVIANHTLNRVARAQLT